jgi:hypothetical protein
VGSGNRVRVWKACNYTRNLAGTFRAAESNPLYPGYRKHSAKDDKPSIKNGGIDPPKVKM